MLIKLKYYGMEFKLDAQVNMTSGKTPSIDINRVNAAKMIRQFIKEKYPKQFKSWVRSESFSGGSSIDVEMCNFDGTPVDETIYTEINNFSNTLRSGRFDGMTDSYDYNAPSSSDNGTRINMYTKYISVSNSPKWGTPEYELSKDK